MPRDTGERIVCLHFTAADLPTLHLDPKATPGVDRGVVFLTKFMADGPKRSREVEAAGLKAGISPGSIRRAAARLGVVFDGTGVWEMKPIAAE